MTNVLIERGRDPRGMHTTEERGEDMARRKVHLQGRRETSGNVKSADSLILAF